MMMMIIIIISNRLIYNSIVKSDESMYLTMTQCLLLSLLLLFS